MIDAVAAFRRRQGTCAQFTGPPTWESMDSTERGVASEAVAAHYRSKPTPSAAPATGLDGASSKDSPPAGSVGCLAEDLLLRSHASPPSATAASTLAPRSTVPKDKLANALASAKPILWRGRGELPQTPWALPDTGAVLVLDLWAGFSSTRMALLARGARCYAIAAEMETDPRDVASSTPE